jgi:hypothetical protein
MGPFVPDDAFPPVNGPHDAAILRREEASRLRELTDLSDTLTDDDYEAAEDAWKSWLEWLAS